MPKPSGLVPVALALATLVAVALLVALVSSTTRTKHGTVFGFVPRRARALAGF